MQHRQMNDEMTAESPVDRSKAPRLLWWGWGLTLGVTTLLAVLIVLPPFLDPVPRFALMRAFSFACHQIPARSPSFHGVQLAVCHRCLGIYWALPLASVAFLFLRNWDARLDRHARYLMAAAVLVPGIDWTLGVTGIWHNTPVSRVATGAFFGFVAGYFLVRSLAQVLQAPQKD